MPAELRLPSGAEFSQSVMHGVPPAPVSPWSHAGVRGVPAGPLFPTLRKVTKPWPLFANDRPTRAHIDIYIYILWQPQGSDMGDTAYYTLTGLLLPTK